MRGQRIRIAYLSPLMRWLRAFWISTNFVAQWCLNTIVSLELTKDYIPETLEEIEWADWVK